MTASCLILFTYLQIRTTGAGGCQAGRRRSRHDVRRLRAVLLRGRRWYRRRRGGVHEARAVQARALRGEFILILVLVRAIRVTSCVFCVQDYVANFWCATSPMVKWRRLLTVSASAKLAGITTLVAMAPAVVRQIQRPSDEGFLWCMACVSTSFFLFSFQVSLFLFTYGQLE